METVTIKFDFYKNFILANVTLTDSYFLLFPDSKLKSSKSLIVHIEMRTFNEKLHLAEIKNCFSTSCNLSK